MQAENDHNPSRLPKRQPHHEQQNEQKLKGRADDLAIRQAKESAVQRTMQPVPEEGIGAKFQTDHEIVGAKADNNRSRHGEGEKAKGRCAADMVVLIR